MTKKNSGPKPTHVAAFGAALSTLAIAPQAQASSIVALKFSPGSVAQSGSEKVQLRTTLGSSLAASVLIFNGSQIELNGASLYPLAISNVVYASRFPSSGGSVVWSSSTASGTHTLAFRSPSNHLGWFQIDLGGSGPGPLTLLAGAYNTTPGGSLHVGDLPTPVPEPAAMGLTGLGLLALGATEIRRRRKSQAKQIAK